MRSTMTLLIRFVMVFFGTLIAAGLLALAEPQFAGKPHEQASRAHDQLLVRARPAQATAGARHVR